MVKTFDAIQLNLLSGSRPKGQLLKWVGNKYKYAQTIVSYFPEDYNRYLEPFVGLGAVLATLAPNKAIAGDTLTPLIEFWNILKYEPKKLISYYSKTIAEYYTDSKGVYGRVRKNYNISPNPLDLMIISRTCYGGVMRFTREGEISTPIGPHKPISPKGFESRVYDWHFRIQNTEFYKQDFWQTMEMASEGDIIYCDPPYIDTQKILYGAQEFMFSKLVDCIGICKNRGAKIALSIDGNKKSGKKNVLVEFPTGLFEREVFLDCGSSMLRRFQKNGDTMIGEDVTDRLLLTW